MTQHNFPASVADVSAIRDAVHVANIPTLLACLIHLTGDERWLGPEFRTTRCRGMDVNDSGGLPPEKRQEIREAVIEAWVSHSAGQPAALPAPRGLMLERMLEQVLGETVSSEYEPMMAEILGLGDQPEFASDLSDSRSDPSAHELTVLVIGAGISGLLAAMRLEEAGIDYTIVEKNDTVGGSWWENSYPGAGVDTPSHLYSYSFHPWRWSTFFGKQPDVDAYMHDVSEVFGVGKRVHFGTEVKTLDFDEPTGTWTAKVTGSDGADEIHADAVISCVGFLNRPKEPDLPGRETFEGTVFHSARWPGDLDVTGKDVVIVGAGASAMQIGPAVADLTKSLSVVQRSPQWIAPNDDYFRAVPDGVHWLMENVPYYAAWYRVRLNWVFNDRVHPTLKIDPDWSESSRSVNATNDKHRRIYESYLRSELGDREDLIAASLPDYPPFGKRMLLDNGWYQMLRRDNVRLVPDGLAGFDRTGVVTSSGQHLAADIVVLATGFHADKFLHPMRVTGAGGTTLEESWGPHDGRAYLGMTTPGFPNLFIMAGPHTGLGHGGSYISVAESQARYIMQVLDYLQTHDYRSAEVRQDVTEEYNEALDAAHDELIWTHPGMSNWYRNPEGRVVVVMPWRIVDYWSWTRQLEPADFEWRGAQGRRSADREMEGPRHGMA